MKLFGFIQKDNEQPEEERPALSLQIKHFIEEIRLKIEKKDRAFRVKAIILTILYIYVTGVLASVFRYFGEISNVGFTNSPKPTITPWGAIGALFSFKYSIIAILITLLICVAILLWWIRNHIGLGNYEFEERGGLKFKKQAMDATLGSAREMLPEEMVQNFTITPASEFKGKNNPGMILFGKDIESGDYVTEKYIKKGERPTRNTLTIGSAGSYKSTNFIIPMVMQLSRAGDNMIINDCSSEISKATYHLLKNRGYNVKIFNILNPEVSDGWNFVGAVGEDPILSKSFARMIIDSSAGKGEGDSFWSEGMYVLLSALILYVNSTPHNTIEQIRHILNNIDVDDYPSLFNRLPIDHPARMEFNTFWTSPVKRNVQNGTAQRLAIFNSTAISKICSSDGIDIIDDLATEGKKTAIFLVTSGVESTFSFVPSLFLTAAATQLSNYAASQTDELTLPTPVHFIMDEFSNTGRVANIGRYLSNTRKYGLIIHLIVQSLPQFYMQYEENEVKDMISNCQYLLVFGVREPDTAEFFEKYCGPTTARTSMTASNSVVLKNTDQYREGEQQRSLYFVNEFIQMESTQYLLILGGKPPIRLNKVYWHDLEDSKYVKDFIMRNYEPQSAEYKPTTNFKVSKSPAINSYNYESSTENNNYIFNEGHETERETQSFRTKEGTKRKQGNRKTKSQSSFAETPPMFQSSYYLERPPYNAGEVISDLKNGNKKVFYFKNSKMNNGKPRQAVLLKYNIDGTTCKIGGTIPENCYIAVKTKLDLDALETECLISKENSILKGWKLQYKRAEKDIITKRLKVAEGNIFINENGELAKSYSFSIPQSDCEISPIFETAKGSNRNIGTSGNNSNIVSTENAIIKM